MWQASIADIDRQIGSYGSAGSITEPVTLAQAKSYCRVDFTDDDVLIQSLITQCRIAIENFCHVSIVPQTVTLSLDMDYSPLPSNWTQYQTDQQMDDIELPYGPIVSILSVTAVDSQNNLYTFVPNMDYFVIGTKFQKIRFVNPQDYEVIVYETGYMAFAGANCPEDLQGAILAQISYMYDNRGDVDKSTGVCDAASLLASPYRRYAWQ